MGNAMQNFGCRKQSAAFHPRATRASVPENRALAAAQPGFTGSACSQNRPSRAAGIEDEATGAILGSYDV